MYNLAKSLVTSATKYFSSVFTGSSNINLLGQIPEYNKDEIIQYFSNSEWESGYMNGYYYGYTPPDDDLDVQLELICRLIHHRFINYSYESGKLLTPIFLPINKRVILYKSDLELLAPRNLESPAVNNNPYRNGLRYKWFCGLVDSFDWDTKLRISSQNKIKQIRITGDWSTYQDINLELQSDESGNTINPTIREICAAIFPLIAHTWICIREIEEYSAGWTISPAEPDILELTFESGNFHIDNSRYAKRCYNETDN